MLTIILGSQILILALLGYAAIHTYVWYIRLRQRATIYYTIVCAITQRIPIRSIVMNVDELLDQLCEEQSPTHTQSDGRSTTVGSHHTPVCDQPADIRQANGKRERLAALAAGGQAKQYLGRNCTVDQIDGMADDEIEKLYTRYEARLGAAMTKTLGAAALQLYSTVASKILPIPPENTPKLIADLEADPFVGHALSSATCELYYKYGMYLAPLTTALATAKYCQFGDQNSCTIQPPSLVPDDDHTRTGRHYKTRSVSNGEGDSATAGGGSASDPSTEGP